MARQEMKPNQKIKKTLKEQEESFCPGSENLQNEVSVAT